jgi:hypothetical protein
LDAAGATAFFTAQILVVVARASRFRVARDDGFLFIYLVALGLITYILAISLAAVTLFL